MDYDKKLDEFENRFLDTKSKDYFFKYIEEARLMIRDIRYFREHIKRTQLSNRFGYHVNPGSTGGINCHFINVLIGNCIRDYNLDEDKLATYLKIYDITKILFDNLDHGNNLDHVDELVEWESVLEWFSGIKLQESIHYFIGCSYGINKVFMKWIKIKGKL